MDFDLSEELTALRDSVRRLAKDKVQPRAREIDETGLYPDDIFAAFRDAGLLGLCIPVEYGGSGAGILGLTIAIEEVAKYSNTCALMLLLTRLPTGPVLIAGSEEQKQRYLPGIAAGSQRSGFGLSESGAGSDVVGMTTRATPDPDREGGWVLNGVKCWMSGVVQADWYTVFAKTGDPSSRRHDSITAFIVDRGYDGVSVGSIDRKMGVRGVDTGELVLSEVRVPGENVIDAPDRRRPGHRPRGGGAHVRRRLRATAPRIRRDDRRFPGHSVGDRQARRRDRGGEAAHVPLGLLGGPGQVHPRMGAIPLDGEVLRDRGSRSGTCCVAPSTWASVSPVHSPTWRLARPAT